MRHPEYLLEYKVDTLILLILIFDSEHFLNRNTNAKIILTSSYILRSCYKGGDAGTTSNAAEVHGKERNLLIYSNVLSGYLDYTTDGHLLVENKEKALSDHVTIYISHERVEVTNYRGYQAVYDSKYLFVLDGGPIEHPRYPLAKPETDIWLSMNRVISGSSRVGTGLCKVAISWV